MAAQTDLWGEIQASDIRTPVSILREQAALLGPKTQNIIEGKVETAILTDSRFLHTLFLVVPALDSYRYALVEISHWIDLYPIGVRGDTPDLKTEEEFREWLSKKLSSNETKRIIANLLAQARG